MNLFKPHQSKCAFALSLNAVRGIKPSPTTCAFTTLSMNTVPGMESLAFPKALSTSLLLRGGAALVNPFVHEFLGAGDTAAASCPDLNRVKIRLEGLSAYGVISILLMNCALALYCSVPKKIQSVNESHYNRGENIITILFTAFSILSIISGFNTAIIFSLTNLYSKTALGLAKDSAFVEFISSTARVRAFGFQSMIVSLMSLKVSFAFSAYLYFKGKFRYIISGFAGMISFLSMFFWLGVINKASFIFI